MLQIILWVAGILIGLQIIQVLAVWLIGERGPVIRPSTREFARISGWKSFLDPRHFFHGYYYLRFLENYVGTGLKVVKIPLIGPMFARLLVGKTYHGKTMTTAEAKSLVTIGKEIPLQDLGERVIPFPVARQFMLQAPLDIAVIECPCRKTRSNPCLPLEVCLAIGQPFVDFHLEHNPGKTRKITKEEAVKIIEEEHKRGHIHTAWFKDATADRFWAICNCCKCCCASNDLRKKKIDLIVASGYIAQVDKKLCNSCMKCSKVCMFDAFAMGNDSAELIWDRCKGCGVCVDKCPQKAIKLVRDEKKGDPLDVAALSKRAALKGKGK